MTAPSIPLPIALRKSLEQAGPDLLRELLQTVVEKLMSEDVDAMCGAEFGQRSTDRMNSRNGYRLRPWDTRVGSMELSIPKLRKGSYFPDWLLEPRRRSEKALLAVVAEAYVLGVSTRRVERLMETLGLTGISKSRVSEIAGELDEAVLAFRQRPLDGTFPYIWLDALEVRCRDGGCVVNVTAVVATGVSDNGRREILGVDVFTREDGAAWLAFLRDLVARGLRGVRLAISDAHAGLKAAIAAVLPGCAWQRCRAHFVLNLLTRVPKSAQPAVATMVRSVFAQPDALSAHAQFDTVLQGLRLRFPHAADLLESAREELLAFSNFPKEHWRQIWSNNPQERLNREIRRRTDVVGIFPNRDALLRLTGALLAEQHDEWTIARRYFSQESLASLSEDSGPTDTVPDSNLLPAA